MLGVAFMVVYTIVSPLMGWLGDRYNRRMLLAGASGLWSLATVGHRVLARLLTTCFSGGRLLGVGEASYGVIAPTCSPTCSPQEPRPGDGDVLPGSAAGRGARVRHRRLGRRGCGWQKAFLVVGLPGIWPRSPAL